MDITFAPNGILQVDNARIIFRNFSGAPSKYNREGDRNFALVIDDSEIADALIEQGWNVKIKEPREDGDDPFIFMSVKVKFNSRGPAVYLETGSNTTKLDEETVGLLDNLDIESVDLDIRPYDWEVNGKTGRSAYLQAIKVRQIVDRFGSAFSENDWALKDNGAFEEPF